MTRRSRAAALLPAFLTWLQDGAPPAADNARMSKTSAPLPGFNAPAVGFEQPFEMLEACHERVQRSLHLLRRIRQHIAKHGHDAASRSALTDVLRYFDLAGPLHHQDEELHVFPALLNHPDETVRAAVAQLRADHVRMHAQWARLRQVLLRWRDDPAASPPTADDDALINDFITGYQRHIPLEETVVYPKAQPLFDAAGLQKAGREMAKRRLQDTPTLL